MVIEIHIPRPLSTLVLVVAAAVSLHLGVHEMLPNFYVQGGQGGDEVPRQVMAKEAEDDSREARLERAVLTRKEEILRHQLEILEAEMARQGRNIDDDLEAEMLATTKRLTSLLQDKHAAELHIREALLQLWDAQARGARVGAGPGPSVELAWPVEPVYGLSADFLDSEYHERFGLPHEGIDLPIEQGSVIAAAADGIVERVVDNGYGYSYVILRHGGMATLYGHISAALVEEGQTVAVGEAIARSGGRPGSLGAGKLSTGPHLHFEVIYDGQRHDPLEFLPDLEREMEE